MKEVEFEIVDERCIKICGIRYSMGLFAYMGFAPAGTIVEIIERTEDGVITIRRHFEAEDIVKDALRYRYIRQSEADLDPFQEQALAAVWALISSKGYDKAKMDTVIDEAMKAAERAAAAATTQEIGHGG